MQDAESELNVALMCQKQALERLNKVAIVYVRHKNSLYAQANYDDAVAECREMDALVAFWRAVLRGKAQLG